MGKLSITGKAEREVSYNAVELRVTFHINAKTTAEALRIVMEQCEKFLMLVTAAGVDMKDIHIGENSVDLNCNYHLTNRAELHMELMKEAVADSKKKAESIAEIMGQKIIGIDSVEYDRNSDMEWMYCEQERGTICSGAMPLSNQLEAPLTTESESISVVWMIE